MERLEDYCVLCQIDLDVSDIQIKNNEGYFCSQSCYNTHKQENKNLLYILPTISEDEKMPFYQREIIPQVCFSSDCSLIESCFLLMQVCFPEVKKFFLGDSWMRIKGKIQNQEDKMLFGLLYTNFFEFWEKGKESVSFTYPSDLCDLPKTEEIGGENLSEGQILEKLLNKLKEIICVKNEEIVEEMNVLSFPSLLPDGGLTYCFLKTLGDQFKSTSKVVNVIGENKRWELTFDRIKKDEWSSKYFLRAFFIQKFISNELALNKNKEKLHFFDESSTLIDLFRISIWNCPPILYVSKEDIDTPIPHADTSIRVTFMTCYPSFQSGENEKFHLVPGRVTKKCQKESLTIMNSIIPPTSCMKDTKFFIRKEKLVTIESDQVTQISWDQFGASINHYSENSSELFVYYVDFHQEPPKHIRFGYPFRELVKQSKTDTGLTLCSDIMPQPEQIAPPVAVAPTEVVVAPPNPPPEVIAASTNPLPTYLIYQNQKMNLQPSLKFSPTYFSSELSQPGTIYKLFSVIYSITNIATATKKSNPKIIQFLGKEDCEDRESGYWEFNGTSTNKIEDVVSYFQIHPSFVIVLLVYRLEKKNEEIQEN